MDAHVAVSYVAPNMLMVRGMPATLLV